MDEDLARANAVNARCIEVESVVGSGGNGAASSGIWRYGRLQAHVAIVLIVLIDTATDPCLIMDFQYFR